MQNWICPDSKVHVTHLGPTWVLSAPVGPHVVPMNLAIRVCIPWNIERGSSWFCFTVILLQLLAGSCEQFTYSRTRCLRRWPRSNHIIFNVNSSSSSSMFISSTIVQTLQNKTWYITANSYAGGRQRSQWLIVLAAVILVINVVLQPVRATVRARISCGLWEKCG